MEVEEGDVKRHCCMPDCKATSSGDVFHEFPKDELLKKEWITACNLTRNVTEDIFICSLHFDELHCLLGPKTKRLKTAANASQNSSQVYEELSLHDELQCQNNFNEQYFEETNVLSEDVENNIVEFETYQEELGNKITTEPCISVEEAIRQSQNSIENISEFQSINAIKQGPIAQTTKKRTKSTNVNRKSCCVPQCTANISAERSYHYFPKQKVTRQQWIAACKLNKPLKSYFTVCSAHFEKEDFAIGSNSEKRMLKSTVVPSLNLPITLKMNTNKQHTSTDTNSSKDKEKVTTIIYLPSNSNKIIQNPNNTKTFIEKAENIRNQKINAMRIQKQITNIQGDKCIKKINSTNMQKQSSVSIQKNISEKILVRKQEKVNIDIEMHGDRNIILRKHNNVEVKTKPVIKKFHREKEISAITICAGCGQYCKIEDNDLLDVGKKNAETLVVEILLELQEVNPLNEEERMLLTKKGIEICDKTLQKQNINLMDLLTNDNELIAFTGIHFELLEKITKLVMLFEGTSIKKFSSSARDRVVMCLCKLRTNLPFRCLAVLFNKTQQVCTNDFFLMIKTLSTLLGKTVYWPKTEELLKNLPKCFQSFKQTRVILHCSETEIEKQRCLKCRLEMVSNNILFETIKYVLGIAPSGLITFKSNTFQGKETDKSIFTQTNILEKLDPTKEAIMADKSLDIETECAERNITLIKLPKLQKDNHYTKSDVELIKNISAARIHVDRTLQRFKMFKILQTKISWRVLPYLDDICTVIAGLVNMKNPIPPDESLLKL